MEDTARLPINAEARLITYLRSRAEIVALVGAHVYSALPKDFTAWPAIRVTQIDSEPIGRRPVVLHRTYLQVDAFGGSKAQAFTLAATAQALVDLDALLADGITSADPGRLIDDPDTLYTPARPRWRFTCSLWAKPLG